MSDENKNEFQEQLEGANTAAEGTDPQAGVSPTAQGSETPGEGTVPGQPGSQAGDTDPQSGNAEQQAEVEGENPGESTGENPETPAEPATPEAGTNSEAETVPTENEAEETDPVGADETPREDGVATKEEQEEYARLIAKRKNMPLDGDDIARWDYLSKLKMEG